MNESYTELLTFFYVIKNYDIAVRYKPEWWQSERLKRLFGIIQPFIIQYRMEPTEQQVLRLIEREGLTTEFTQDIIHSMWESRQNLAQFNEEWLRDCCEAYGEFNSLMNGVNRLYSTLVTSQSEVTVENAHEIVQKIKSSFSHDTNFDLNMSRGSSFLDPEVHIISRPETHTTGFPFLDKCLGGGWAKKTLVVTAGGPKVGKSIFLCNMCRQSILQGNNCAYITLEMSVGEVCSRIGAAMFGIPFSQYDKYARTEGCIAGHIKQIRDRSLKGLGECIIEQFPTSNLTPFEMEAFLLSIEAENSAKYGKDWKFSEIYVDYINIMRSARAGIGASDSYTRIKTIAEDLRAVAIRNNWTIVSLTQLSRGYSVGCSDIDITGISESHGLVQTVDCLMGIIQTVQMRLEGIYYMKALACRNSQHGGDRKSFKFESDYMRLTEDPNEDIIPEGIPLPAALTVGAPDAGSGNRDYNGGYGPRKSRGDNQNSAANNTAPSAPPQTPPQSSTPDLGISTMKINQFDLFNM